MKYLNEFVAILTLAAACTLAQAQPTSQLSPKAEQNISHHVMHQLRMLPYVTVFDNIGYRVAGDTVTLVGQVTRPVLRTDAEQAVKEVEGVTQVNDQIEVLPNSIVDDHLRFALARAIYGYGPLERYAIDPQAPIRIIVKNGHATLVGVVANKMDEHLAVIRANGVPGVFSVTDNLRLQG
jgi:hyperosmotically inducible protein